MPKSKAVCRLKASFAPLSGGCYLAAIHTRRSLESGLVARVWLFALASVAVALFIAVATFTAWKHLRTLQANLNTTQSKSFNIAKDFQGFFLNLNSSVLQYEIKADPHKIEQFDDGWERLNLWIDRQRPSLITKLEGEILDEIDRSFDKYHVAARNLFKVHNPKDTQSFEEFARFQEESDRLIKLGYDLADAHQIVVDQLYAETNRSTARLRAVLVTAFALLILLSGGIWGLVYRDMIVPLQARLIESHALLERQEKLASLGVLSAGLAHEIRNPLTAMKARLFTLGKRLPSGSAQEQDASVISREVDRLERILKDFLEFARPSDPKIKPVRALDFLHEVRSLLQLQLQQQYIQLLLEEGANPVIQIDPQQMTQVMLNLIRNAAESIGQNGTVALRVREESVLLKGRQSNVAVLEVADTGRGITPEVEKRLFDPFHTTKDGGTGLGLSIAGRIVERHGGALRYKTRVGHGTTFGVVLPRALP
jgi:signal transduction histidine kinase